MIRTMDMLDDARGLIQVSEWVCVGRPSDPMEARNTVHACLSPPPPRDLFLSHCLLQLQKTDDPQGMILVAHIILLVPQKRKKCPWNRLRSIGTIRNLFDVFPLLSRCFDLLYFNSGEEHEVQLRGMVPRSIHLLREKYR